MIDQLHSHLVALSYSHSYNHSMNYDTINTITTILLLSPLLVIPVALMVDLYLSRKETERVLFGPVHRQDK